MTAMAERADASHPDAATEQAHRHEQPSDWGWNGAWGKWARIGGWASVVILCLLNVTTYYNTAQAPWLYGCVAVLVLLLVRDRYRRKNAWRDE
jgi:hypothetical protein